MVLRLLDYRGMLRQTTLADLTGSTDQVDLECPTYMLLIISWTDQTAMDCWKLLYTLSLYGNMLIIVIIVLILLMSIVLNFYCYILDADCCMIGLLIFPLMALSL